MNAAMFRDILTCIETCPRALLTSDSGDDSFVSRTTEDQNHSENVLECQSQSPDLNASEHFRRDLPCNLMELEKNCKANLVVSH